MNLSAPSWDLFIALFLIISVGYGFLLQRERIVVTVVASYIALIVVQLLWPEVFGFFQGTNPIAGKYFIKANFSPAAIQIGLFVMAMVLISIKAGIDAERGRGWLSPFELAILSVLAGALILSTILNYMPAENVATLAEQSKLVAYLVKYHVLWILAPVATMVAFGIRDGRRGD